MSQSDEAEQLTDFQTAFREHERRRKAEEALMDIAKLTPHPDAPRFGSFAEDAPEWHAANARQEPASEDDAQPDD